MESSVRKRQFGLWESLITPQSMAGQIRLADVAWDSDGSLVWLEFRSGRGVLMMQPADLQAPRELNVEHAVGARLNFGGGEFTIANGQVYYVDSKSGRIYRQPISSGPAQPITPEFGYVASPTLSPDGNWLIFLHSYEGRDVLAIVDSEGENWPRKLNSTHDFYMQPTWHPAGEQIAWVAWDHPNMPWDGTSLYLGKLRFDVGHAPIMEDIYQIAGDNDTSIFQPEFSPDGRYLAYASDQSGWWQLYLYDLQNRDHKQLTTVMAEHGLPAWLQGMRTYGFAPNGNLFTFRNQHGTISLWQIEPDTGVEKRLNLDKSYTHLSQIRVSNHGIAILASGGQIPERVITYKPEPEPIQIRIRQRSTTEMLSSEAYSLPKPIDWSGMDGGRVFGLYFSPHNDQYIGTGKPPLIVNIHSGPTSQVGNSFNPDAQFFTSRGYAYLEVNYRGSTGYGREYRNMLRGNWGIFDVQDAVSGAKHLASTGSVDEKRLVVYGSSAGGFSVLKALEDYPGFFKAGICLYGVSNQFTLAAETHKFELHYADTLLGPLPEAAHIYRERSPIFFADQIQDPVLLFQGDDDQVVPRSQSDELAASLRRRGVPHEYHVYSGEGHGFRKPENIEHLYQTIDRFLRQHVIYT